MALLKSGTRIYGNATVDNDLTTGGIGYFSDIALLDDASPSNYLRVTNSANLTIDRVLSVNVNDGNRTITLSGNLSLANNFTTSGNFALTLTTTAATNVTLPTSGTLATTAGTLSSSTTSTQTGYFGNIALYDDSTPSHYLTVTNSANLTAARTLSVNVNDADRTITLSGNLSLANNFTTSGNFALTLTTTAATNVTLPTSGTLATTGNLSQFGATTSAQLAGVISDETGSGALVFGTSPTLTTPRIASSSSIDDSNGNQLIQFPASVASAVNQLEISNAATGNAVSITTSGDDTNIGLNISTKGTGAIVIDTGTGAGQIDLKPGSSNVRIWDDNSTHYYQFVTGDRTANYNITLPAGNVTLQTGTMAVTGTGLNQFASTTSAQLAGVISDETGTGVLVFGTSPSITTALNTGSTSFNLINATATTVNFAGAATALTIGATTGTTTLRNNVVITGDLTINGTTTTVNSTTLTLDDPIITLGGDTSVAETTKDRGVEFKWNGIVLTITNYIGNGTTTVTGTVASTSGYAAGDIITISGATGTEQTKLNGTWTIASVPNSTTFTFVVGSTVAAGTYTTTLGTTVKSKNGFFGLDQSTGRFTFIPQSSQSGEVYSGSLGELEIGGLILGDDKFITAGNGSDLFIGHVTSGNWDYLNANYITAQNGSLNIEAAESNSVRIKGPYTQPTLALFTHDAGCELYWGGATGSGKKLETTTTGILVSGAGTFRGASSIRSEAAATQDAVVLAGRAGGTASYAVTLTPATLSANRTITLPNTTGTVYVSSGTDVSLADGGTNASLTAVNGGIVYSTASAMAISAAGTAGQFLRSAGAAAPTWSTLEMTDIPGAVYKKSVKAATTADLGTVTYANGTAGVGATITGPTGASAVVFPAQDGITLALNDRLLVKNQTTAAQNGIYVLTTVGVAGTTAWVLTRATDADTNAEIGAAVVAVDQGTANGGEAWTTNFKSTDTVGTTSMSWNEVLYNNFSGPTFSGTLTAATIRTTGNIELGNASDTTLSRAAAGRLAVEGVNVVTISSTDTLTNKTLTAPKITSASHIADSNGNELIKFPTAVGSAVNEITISNAATAGTPSITASGGDANVSLDISAKGTGTVNLPSGTTKIGTTTITQGGAVDITLPSTAGTLALTSEILTNSNTSTQSGYFGDIFLYDDSTPSHYLGITNSANLTAARTLSINVNDADRTISLSGDLTLANNFTTSGNFALTLTTTAATNVTLPTTGTLATTAGTLSSSTTSTQSGYFGNIHLYDDSTPSHYLGITNSANLTAARTLSINVNDANRTISLSGNLTLANSFTTSGNFALTLTTTAATSVTLPTSGTLATTAGTLSSSTTSTANAYFGTVNIVDTGLNHYLTLNCVEDLSADRILTLNVNNADRLISLSGNLTLANSFTTSGNFDLTLTTTAATNVTLPTTGTLATTAGTLSSSTTSTQSGYFGNIHLFDDSTPSHYLQITNGANLTAARTLTLNTGDASRTITLSGNLSIANNFTTSGNFALTLTTTAATNVTLPTSGTLANTSTVSTVANSAANSVYNTLVSQLVGYELDDISTAVDGIENTFVPTFNYDKVTFATPFQLLITVNGIIQSAYQFNTDYVHLTHCLAAKSGYTIDQDGNIKFTESLPMGSEVLAKITGNTPRSTYKYYPFSALDIMLYK